MNIHDLTITIEHIRGSYKKFANSTAEFPILGVTFPTHYGYINGYTGEDDAELDVFLGNGNLLGYIKLHREDIGEGVIETKMFLHISEQEKEKIIQEYDLVLAEVQEFESESEFMEFIKEFKD